MRFFILGEKIEGTNLRWLTLGVLKYLRKSKSLFMESLRKILYQAYHLLKKVKSAEMSTCEHFQICLVFPPEKKLKNTTDEQTDRQQIWFTGTLYLERTK
jgi:hypothetical protein